MLKSIILTFIISLFCGIHSSFAIDLPKWFPFGEQNSLNEWQEKIFKGRVLYSIKTEDSNGYLSACSRNAASGIVYRIRFNPRQKPLVSWKWKVIRFPDKKEGAQSRVGWIEKDDYAARFYIIFPAFFFTMTKSLEYVWDKDTPEGTISTSPYFGNIKIITAESGEENLGKWVIEKRNISEDYKKAFGDLPPIVGAIAIMTDTDNSISTAEAHYDEIKIGYK